MEHTTTMARLKGCSGRPGVRLTEARKNSQLLSKLEKWDALEADSVYLPYRRIVSVNQHGLRLDVGYRDEFGSSSAHSDVLWSEVNQALLNEVNKDQLIDKLIEDGDAGDYMLNSNYDYDFDGVTPIRVRFDDD